MSTFTCPVSGACPRLPLPYQGIQTECFWQRFNRKAVQHYHRQSQTQRLRSSFSSSRSGPSHGPREKRPPGKTGEDTVVSKPNHSDYSTSKAHQCKRLQDHKTAKASAPPGRPAEAINVEDAALGRCYRCGLQCGRNLFRHALLASGIRTSQSHVSMRPGVQELGLFTGT